MCQDGSAEFISASLTAPALPLCEMLADLPRPCRHNGTCCGKGTGHVRQRCEVLAHARRITGELDGVLGADAKTARDLPASSCCFTIART